MQKRRQWITLRRMGRGAVICFLLLGAAFILSCLWSAVDDGLGVPAEWPYPSGNAALYKAGRLVGIVSGVAMGCVIIVWCAKELHRRQKRGDWAAEPLPMEPDPPRVWPKVFWGCVIAAWVAAMVLQVFGLVEGMG